MTAMPARAIETRECSGRESFSLIELMVVMIVLAVLAGLTFPVILKARKHAFEKKAEADTVMIREALKKYVSVYGRWPYITNDAFGDGVYWTNNFHIIGPLTQPTNRANPRKMVFLVIQESQIDTNGNMVDPWGKPYRICQDENFDGTVFMQKDTEYSWRQNINGTNYSTVCCGWPF